MISSKIITDMRVLKAMGKRGLIRLYYETGLKVWNCFTQKEVIAYYVGEVENKFCYKNKSYEIKYFSGCFYPFVVEVEK